MVNHENSIQLFLHCPCDWRTVGVRLETLNLLFTMRKIFHRWSTEIITHVDKPEDHKMCIALGNIQREG